MAAFSLHQQYPAIPADSICLPYVSATKMDCVLDEFITNFSHIYASSEHCQNLASDHDHMEGSSFDATAHYSSCIEQLSIQNISCVTEKEIPQSLLIADKAEHGEQVTQTRVAADRKRKFRNWSSLDSANSKGAQQVIYKKLKGAKVATNEVEKDQNKANEEPTKRCIHVRAKRGQATDSHSLAERVRREKISEKMRMLQALVPGCDKVTGKALMLDEVINYVQSLQNQVEFLSMKLTSLHPMVYTFGLMDNDVMTFGSQVTNNDTALTIPLVQPTSSGYGSASLARALANANALASSATSSAASGSSFTSPLVDGSTNLMQHEQKGARSSYWGLNEQEGQNIINQFGFRATT